MKLAPAFLAILTSLAPFSRGVAISAAAVEEGNVFFSYKGETHQTFFKIYGDINTSGATPLVVVHGGPGLSHDYLLPIADLAIHASTPVVFYDQIGNARSTHLPDKPVAFWTIDLFVDELANLLKTLSIEDSFHLLGHSWGGALAMEFVARRQPSGLRRLIISNSYPSYELWLQSQAQLLKTFPKSVQEGLAGGMSNRERYLAAMKEFDAVHLCTVVPWPAEMNYSLDVVVGPKGDMTVTRAGLLAGWSIVEHLQRIRVDTLLVNGASDVSQDFVVEPLFRGLPNAKWITLENSSHTPFWEQRDIYVRAIGDFLRTY